MWLPRWRLHNIVKIMVLTLNHDLSFAVVALMLIWTKYVSELIYSYILALAANGTSLIDRDLRWYNQIIRI